jgi:pimeloyl-ACP methyl ester carboxylesterase
MWSHMAFRKLAGLLTREGFHVLRFDYYGTGDSAGDSSGGSLAEWRQNLVAAAADLRECADVSKVSVIGFRLGAALAASAGLRAANLILWEPVVSGPQYIDELRRIHSRQFSNLLFPPPLPRRGAGGDLLGYGISAEMEADIEAFDLRAHLATDADHIALVTSDERVDYASLSADLSRRTADGRTTFEYCYVADESATRNQEAMLLSTQVLQTMTAVLARRAR